MSPLHVAIVGATGAVGEVMRRVLEERNFPLDTLSLVASKRSAGTTRSFRGNELTVQDLESFDFQGVHLALFSAGASVSRTFAPKAAQVGCLVIDNSSCFRYDDPVPLVVPEVNPQRIADHRGIIANPNCSTIQLVVALHPLHQAAHLTRINIATYQAVSGTGQAACDELREQTQAHLEDRTLEPQVYPQSIAFNALPHIDDFQDNGYTREEMKIIWETRKILAQPNLAINPTAVRVPVYYGHSEAVHLETRDSLSADQARSLLQAAPGVVVLDQPTDNGYPTARQEAENCDAVFVGRIRDDLSCENGLDLWVVSDNLRKGAATNSIQIAEQWLAQCGP